MTKIYSYNESNVDEYEAAHNFDFICRMYAQILTLKDADHTYKEKSQRKLHKQMRKMGKQAITELLDKYMAVEEHL